jgi:hypothetical protein
MSHFPASSRWVLSLGLVFLLVGCGGSGADRRSASENQAAANAGGELLLDDPTPEPTASTPVPSSEVVTTDPDATYSSWTTFSQATKQSRANGKAVLIAFNAEWSDNGQALQREVFDNAAGGTTVKAAVIPVAVVDRSHEDGRNAPDVEALVQQFRVDTFPTLVIFSPGTGRVVRQTGYPGAAETLRWITEGATVVTAQ